MTGGITGFIDFSADTVLETTRISINTIKLIIVNIIGGTITSPGNAFTGIKTDSIIQYQLVGSDDITFNRVDAISSDLKTLGLGTATGSFRCKCRNYWS